MDRYVTYVADTEEGQTIHYGIRYAVYCERKGYEAPAETGMREERDRYDTRAIKFIVRDRLTRRWQGAARLITNSNGPLPAEEFGAVDRHWARCLRYTRYAEVSRLSSLSTAAEGRHATEALLRATVAGLTEYSVHEQLDYLVFLITPALARVLRGVGIPMECCGPDIEHRGLRRAYAVNIEASMPMVGWLCDRLAHGAAYQAYSEATPARPAPVRPATVYSQVTSKGTVSVLRPQVVADTKGRRRHAAAPAGAA
jgi:N-acyl-L-homoserine lactone synthetase